MTQKMQRQRYRYSCSQVRQANFGGYRKLEPCQETNPPAIGEYLVALGFDCCLHKLAQRHRCFAAVP